jgi:hypothetical protein
MTLEDIKTWLQDIVKSPAYYTGSIDTSKDNCIGIYEIEGPKPEMAIGGLQNKGYGIKPISFLIHWGKYAPAAELKAQELYDALYGNPHNAVIGGQRVIQFDMRQPAPVSLDTDDNGIFEYVVQTNIYYERR